MDPWTKRHKNTQKVKNLPTTKILQNRSPLYEGSRFVSGAAVGVAHHHHYDGVPLPGHSGVPRSGGADGRVIEVRALLVSAPWLPWLYNTPGISTWVSVYMYNVCITYLLNITQKMINDKMIINTHKNISLQ